MADKNDTFVLARRREDGVEMILGRKLILASPHKFEEVISRAPKLVKAEVPEQVVEESDISMVFNTADFDSYKGTTLTTVEGYRAALDDMDVEYKMTHGIPGLKRLYEENK